MINRDGLLVFLIFSIVACSSGRQTQEVVYVVPSNYGSVEEKTIFRREVEFTLRDSTATKDLSQSRFLLGEDTVFFKSHFAQFKIPDSCTEVWDGRDYGYVFGCTPNELGQISNWKPLRRDQCNEPIQDELNRLSKNLVVLDEMRREKRLVLKVVIRHSEW